MSAPRGEASAVAAAAAEDVAAVHRSAAYSNFLRRLFSCGSRRRQHVDHSPPDSPEINRPSTLPNPKLKRSKLVSGKPPATPARLSRFASRDPLVPQQSRDAVDIRRLSASSLCMLGSESVVGVSKPEQRRSSWHQTTLMAPVSVNPRADIGTTELSVLMPRESAAERARIRAREERMGDNTCFNRYQVFSGSMSLSGSAKPDANTPKELAMLMPKPTVKQKANNGRTSKHLNSGIPKADSVKCKGSPDSGLGKESIGGARSHNMSTGVPGTAIKIRTPATNEDKELSDSTVANNIEGSETGIDLTDHVTDYFPQEAKIESDPFIIRIPVSAANAAAASAAAASDAAANAAAANTAAANAPDAVAVQDESKRWNEDIIDDVSVDTKAEEILTKSRYNDDLEEVGSAGFNPQENRQGNPEEVAGEVAKVQVVSNGVEFGPVNSFTKTQEASDQRNKKRNKKLTVGPTAGPIGPALLWHSLEDLEESTDVKSPQKKNKKKQLWKMRRKNDVS